MTSPPPGGPHPTARAGPSTRSLVGLVLLLGLLLLQLYAVYWPTEPAPQTFTNEDKVAHLLIFGLPVFVSVVFGLWPRIVVPLVALHAPVSELIQGTLLPGRDGDVRDVGADLVGVALGLLLGLLLLHRRPTPP